MESLKSRIKSYIQARTDWVTGIEIERLAMDAGYKASNASRRCRELEDNGDIEVGYDRGFARYRAVSKPLNSINELQRPIQDRGSVNTQSQAMELPLGQLPVQYR